MTKKRIGAFIGALVLIGILLFLTMAFTGNPLSKILAQRSINKYVEKNYSHLDLSLGQAEYDFKLGQYYAECQSRDSKDLHFTIYSDMLGRNTRDSYESSVEERSNTYLRLNDEFEAYVKFFLKEDLDYNWLYIFANLETDSDKKMRELKLDQPLFINQMPLEQNLNLTIIDQPSYDRLEEVLLEVDRLLEEKNIRIDKYSLSIQDKAGEKYLGVLDFKKEDLKKDNLRELLEENYKKNN